MMEVIVLFMQEHPVVAVFLSIIGSAILAGPLSRLFIK